MKRITGRYERVVAGSEEVSTFMPLPRPPRKPSLALDDQLRERLRDKAHPAKPIQRSIVDGWQGRQSCGMVQRPGSCVAARDPHKEARL